jgi:CBS-domain-containing membrane protein
MVPDVTFAHKTNSLATIIDKMCTEKLHRLIILDDHEHVSGIITTMDVMCYLRQAYKAT